MKRTFESELYARAKREGWRPLPKPGRMPKWLARGLASSLVAFGVVLFGTIGLVILPLAIFFPVAVPIGFGQGDSDAVDLKSALPPEIALGLQSSIVAGSAFLAGAAGYRLFVPMNALGVLPFFPVEDRNLRRHWMRSWLLAFSYCLYAWRLSAVLLAWRNDLSFWQLSGLITLGFVQFWHLAAFSVAIARWLPPEHSLKVTATGLWCLLAAFLCALVLAMYPRLTLPSIVSKVLLCSLFGWVYGTMSYGVIEGKPIGWLLLAPAAVLWIYAIGIWKRGFAIRELRIEPVGGVTPIFEYGFPNATERSKPPAEKSTAKRLEENPALAPPDWSGGWFVERWIGKRLAARDKSLLEHVYGGRPRWTLTFSVAVGAMLLLASAAAYLQALGIAGEFREGVIGVFTFPFLIIVLLAELCAAARGAGQYPTLTPLYPCGLRETLHAFRKPLLARCSLLAPLFVSLATIENWHRENQELRVLGVLSIAAALLLALAPIAARWLFFSAVRTSKRLTSRWWRSLAASLLLIVLGFSIILSEDWQVKLSLAVLLLVSSRYACWRMDRLFDSGELDFDSNRATRKPYSRNNP